MKKIILLSLTIALAVISCGKRSLPPEDSLKVQLDRPADGVQVTNMREGFNWARFPGAESYLFQLWGENLPDTLEVIVSASVLYPDFRILNGEYFWRVGVVRGNAVEHWSEVSRFVLSQRVIVTVPPYLSVLNGTRVFFNWFAYPHSNGYLVRIWPKGDPDNPVFEGVEFSSSFTPIVPFFDGDYCWSVAVRAGDEGEFSHWSDTLEFTIRQYPFRLVDTLATRGAPRDVYPFGDVLYVGDGFAGLLICDRTDPLNPERVGWHEPSGQYENRAIWIDEETSLMVIADYMGNPPILWYNISRPLDPTLDSWSGLFCRKSQDVAGVRYRDTVFVAFADYDDGGFVFDLHDTDDRFVTPRGRINPNGLSYGVAFADSLFFLSAGHLGVFIAKTTNADLLVGHVDTPGDARKMAISGNYCYVADGLGGLTVIDFSDPTAPFVAGRADMQTGMAQNIAVEGNYCYLACGSGGTVIYDVSDPRNPMPIQEIAGMYSYSVAVDGDIIYIADRDWGVLTLTR
ncbi:MAG TPA: hypothetical protein ENN07_04000 [candidate division Zixibacteria bacterium]|nr:hypothetical protein [candidate division Zixibacteria bacterium]